VLKDCEEPGHLNRYRLRQSFYLHLFTNYSYLGDNRLKTVTFVRGAGGVDSKTFTYSYDPGGRLASIEYPTSTGITAYFDDGAGNSGWDGHGQLKFLRYEKGASDLRRFEYTYDKAGNRTTQKDIPSTGDSKLWVNEYDYLDRLVKVSLDTNSDSSLLSVANAQAQSMYSYDASDNRIELNLVQLNEILTYTYDDADNITERFKDTGSGPVSIETFTSDDVGNLKTRTSGAVTTTYSWTDFNRLAEISTTDNSKKQTHTFGVNGFRRKKKDKNDLETTDYAPGLATAVAKNSAKTVTYLMGHQLLGMEVDGTMYFYLSDALSTVRDIVRGTDGAVLESYSYDERSNKTVDLSGGINSSKTYWGGLSVNDDDWSILSHSREPSNRCFTPLPLLSTLLCLCSS
jgi:YD repeat-containing protein